MERNCVLKCLCFAVFFGSYITYSNGQPLAPSPGASMAASAAAARMAVSAASRTAESSAGRQVAPSLSETAELRSMLKQALDQNMELENQNSRLKQIWTGLRQMCTALPIQKCDCANPDTTTVQQDTTTFPTTTVTPPTTSTQTVPDPPLRIIAITSSGELAGDPVNVSVHYTASSDHTVEWLVVRRNGGMLRTNGLTGRYEIDNSTYRYFTRLEFPSLNDTRQALVRIYSNTESASMRLNLTALVNPGDQFLPEPESAFTNVENVYVAPPDTDLNVTLTFKEDPRRNPDFAGSNWEIFFTGLNTSTDPNTVFETHVIPRIEGMGIGLSLLPRPNSTGGPDMVVTLRYPYVQYGGILTIRLPKRIGGFVQELFQGKFIKVLSSATKELVPYNNLGVFPLPSQTILYPPSQSILCASMGNPRPEVSILRLFNDGTYIEPMSDTLIKDEVTHMKSLTLSSSNPLLVEGTYICRATNGNQTVDTQTDVYAFQPAVFDDIGTGVKLQNTTFSVEISCLVTGKPKPRLEIRLYNQYGPDLSQSGLFMVSREDIGPFASKLTLLTSPADVEVSSVYCASVQKSMGAEFEQFRKIDVFPGATTDWDFYNRVQNLV